MLPINAILLMVFFVGAPLALTVMLVRQHRLTLALRERGRPARGKVVRIRASWLNVNHVFVEYVFRLPDGSEIHGKYKLHRHVLPSQPVSEGDPLEFLYLPDAPHRHQRADVESGRLNLLTGIFGLAVLLTLAFITWMNAR